ncbi:hypothetical protein QFZ82_004357 [Streptomyces sp. V4I23]|uniref:hypothetical protein n=1 Tax=Streptomyces sp. V4I23 TaxID=3042282 RepID=UPI00277FDF0B|nr:hypothetical protein [Streptomyces sp. V4I23]MDQ1009872.1 hypothetical protein [Streptomyces sp. V4I23]
MVHRQVAGEAGAAAGGDEALGEISRAAYLVNHQEVDVVVTAVASVGSQVDAAGVVGFIDQVKHSSWWSADVAPPQVGDHLRAVVLDDSRTPPRLSALERDIEIAQVLRERE